MPIQCDYATSHASVATALRRVKRRANCTKHTRRLVVYYFSLLWPARPTGTKPVGVNIEGETGVNGCNDGDRFGCKFVDHDVLKGDRMPSLSTREYCYFPGVRSSVILVISALLPCHAMC